MRYRNCNTNYVFIQSRSFLTVRFLFQNTEKVSEIDYIYNVRLFTQSQLKCYTW